MNGTGALAASQRGAALIMALIFLLVLTLLGTSGTMNNSMQERMSSNTRNRDLAFQAAEHALTAADQWIHGLSPPLAATTLAAAALSAAGDLHDNDLDYWTDSFDWGTTGVRHPGTLADLRIQPAYVVERLPSANCPANPAATCAFYRVTARGLGAATEAVVILQTMYAIQ